MMWSVEEKDLISIDREMLIFGLVWDWKIGVKVVVTVEVGDPHA